MPEESTTPDLVGLTWHAFDAASRRFAIDEERG